MSNNKQSSIDWLVEKMLTQDWYTYKSLEYIKQAKAMHKEEIERAHYDGSVIVISKPDDDMLQLAEQYYNEHFDTKREITQNQILEEIQDLQDTFLKIGATERYYAMTMLKDRILTFNTKEE